MWHLRIWSIDLVIYWFSFHPRGLWGWKECGIIICKCGVCRRLQFPRAGNIGPCMNDTPLIHSRSLSSLDLYFIPNSTVSRGLSRVFTSLYAWERVLVNSRPTVISKESKTLTSQRTIRTVSAQQPLKFLGGDYLNYGVQSLIRLITIATNFTFTSHFKNLCVTTVTLCSSQQGGHSLPSDALSYSIIYYIRLPALPF